MDSKNITATKGRLDTVMDSVVRNSIKNYGIEEKITKAVDENKVRTGVVTKAYPYLDKVEVKLDKSGEKILCKILHKFGGDLLDLYTPLGEKKDYDDKLKEPYIKPRLKLHCLILSINDEDSKENLLLGYYQNDELIGLNPAKPGNMKLASTNEVNQFWIKFGAGGLDLRLPSETTVKVGGLDENMKEVDYDNDKVYSKEEVDALIQNHESDNVYTKEEVDSLLSNFSARLELLEAEIEDMQNNTSP